VAAGKIVETLEARTADQHEVAVSVVRISSDRPGPVLAVIAGMHGTEYASVAALGRLAQTVRPMDVTGTLVLIPVASGRRLETRRGSVPSALPRPQYDPRSASPGRITTSGFFGFASERQRLSPVCGRDVRRHSDGAG